MAISRMQITVEQEMDGCLFCMTKPIDGNKKKRQSLRVNFVGKGGTLTVPTGTDLGEFATNGTFTFTQPVKGDLFGSKDYRIFLPFKALDWLEVGCCLTIEIQRLEEDGTVTGEGSLSLLINSGKRAVAYTDSGYLGLFSQNPHTAEKLQFAEQYAKGETFEEAELFVEVLTKLATEEKNGQAEYVLHLFYGNDHSPLLDEEKEMVWLRRAAAKGYRRGIELLGQREAPEQTTVEIVPAPANREECVAAAQAGSPSAQFALYQALREEDGKTADHWLELSVQNGYHEGVEELESRLARSFLPEGARDRFIAVLQAGAEKGSLTALYKLFDLHYTGMFLGIPGKRDKRTALWYLKQASDAGLTKACYRMWQIYEDGNDLLIQPEEAAELLQKAAETGSAAAMNDLGELYVTGRIVEKDGVKGIALIQKAAELDCFQAQMRVYQMHKEGRYYDLLFAQDEKQAQQLLLRYAKEAGNPFAQMALWMSYCQGNPILLTRFEALDFLSQAANQDYETAVYAMACAHLDGIYKDVDLEEGARLLERGGKLGCPRCQFALFHLYYTGRFHALQTAVNKERAYKWILEAATDNPGAQYQMWRLYVEGNEMSLEIGEALAHLQTAARMNWGDALEATAVLSAKGKYLPCNVGYALEYLKLGVSQRHSLSMYRLYEAYSRGSLEGKEVAKDEHEAYRMLLNSAQLGYEPACREVCRLYESGNVIGVDRQFVKDCRAFFTKEAAKPTALQAVEMQMSEPVTD